MSGEFNEMNNSSEQNKTKNDSSEKSVNDSSQKDSYKISYEDEIKNTEPENINIEISESNEEEKIENFNLKDEKEEREENSLTVEAEPVRRDQLHTGIKKRITPLDILATVAEMESERITKKGPYDQPQPSKRRPGRPRTHHLDDTGYTERPKVINISHEQYMQNPYYFKKLKVRNYESKDGEPQKIVIHKRKDSEQSKENNESSKSSIDKYTDAYIIKKYGDIPESTFTTGFREGILVYLCPEDGCGKYFPSISRAKRHFIIHTEAKPYKCPNPGCNKRFSRKDNMNQHCRLHCKFANN